MRPAVNGGRETGHAITVVKKTTGEDAASLGVQVGPFRPPPHASPSIFIFAGFIGGSLGVFFTCGRFHVEKYFTPIFITFHFLLDCSGAELRD